MLGRKRREVREAQAKAERRAVLISLIDLAEGGLGSSVTSPLILKSGERLVYAIAGGGLFEPRRQPGHYRGRSSGVSVPLGGGFRYRVGQSSGTYVPGDEVPQIIDTGTLSITTQRVVFQGAKYTREWSFSKLVGMLHYQNQPWSAIQVSNRQKTSGIVYRGQSTELIRLRLAVAVAIFHGEARGVAEELRHELLQVTPPVAELPAGDSSPAATVDLADDLISADQSSDDTEPEDGPVSANTIASHTEPAPPSLVLDFPCANPASDSAPEPPRGSPEPGRSDLPEGHSPRPVDAQPALTLGDQSQPGLTTDNDITVDSREPNESEPADQPSRNETVLGETVKADLADRERPVSGLLSSSELPPPAWAADPARRHQLRWWDGSAWTSHVADYGQQAIDPL